MTLDEESKKSKRVIPNKKKSSKKNHIKAQQRFEILMNSGSGIEYEMRLMDSKLRKINKE